MKWCRGDVADTVLVLLLQMGSSMSSPSADEKPITPAPGTRFERNLIVVACWHTFYFNLLFAADKFATSHQCYCVR
jgi:hypothetical protein